MRHTRVLGVPGLAKLLGLIAIAAGRASAVGPDISIGDINPFMTFGTVADPAGNLVGFMFGKTDCNLGDEPVDVFANTDRHPIVTENMYRYAVVGGAGRFEHVGMSHCFHEFFPLQGTLCHADCQPDPNSTARLGVHCSSSDSPSAMGQQQALGPRDEVDAFTGRFAFPMRATSDSSAVGERLRVRERDIRPSLNPGALWYGEVQIIAPDDAAAGNGTNNASHRQLAVIEGLPSIGLRPYPSSATQRTRPAIMAWADLDPGVHVTTIDVPGEGRFHVAWNVTPIGPCRWHYEYAIHNLNSDRSGGAFVLPLPAWNVIDRVGFHAPERHSGDVFSNDPWVVARTPTTLAWSSPREFATDPNSNALRWGTLYNFRFDSPHAPALRQASLMLFKPGTPERVPLMLDVPGGCPADTDDGTGTGKPDCGVTVDDLLYYLASFGDGLARADFDDGSGTGTPDGGVTIEDLLYYLQRYGEGC